MGWFYRFKLHIVINEHGEIMQWTLTPENVDDREPQKDKEFTKNSSERYLPTGYT